MRRMRRCLTLLSTVLFAVVLGGCDLLAGIPPELSVTPQSVHFSPDDLVKSLRLDNVGGGTIGWTVESDQAWLAVGGPSSGNTTLEIDEILLTINRTALASSSTNAATVTLIPTVGASIAVPVTVTVVGPPLLVVSAAQLDFPVSVPDSQMFTLTNDGGQALDFTATISNAPWLTVTPLTGTLAAGAETALTATVSRSGLSAGTLAGAIIVSSPGLDDTTISVSLDVEPFSISPTVIDFGRILGPASTQLEVNNAGGADLVVTLTATTSSGGDWLSVDPVSGTVTSTTSLTTLVTADPAGLAPGIYAGEVSVVPVSTGTAQVVPVTMEIAGFVVSPDTIDFGTIDTSATDTITVTNLGSQPTTWSITVPASDAVWLSVSPLSGTTATTDEITVTVDPLAVDPGAQDSELTIMFDDGAGIALVSVSMARPRPPELKVEPGTIDFSVSRTSELVGIWNDGTGTIGWRIDTSSFPAWLSIAPDSPIQPDLQSIVSGVVSGAQTDSVVLAVDRSMATPGQLLFEYEFGVEASQDSTEIVPVTVKMQIAEFSVFSMDTDLNFNETDEVLTFVITNEQSATGALQWRVDPDQEIPAFIASISPEQGIIEPNITSDADRNVTVRVSRDTLDFNGDVYELRIITNDPENPEGTVRISVDVPLVISLGSRPAVLDFGKNATTLGVEIANFGDPFSVANFVMLPSQDWIKVFEEGGSSIGIAGPTKDWRGFSVSIDRSELPNDSPSAEIVARAIDPSTSLPVLDEEGNFIDTIIEVKATAASLTIEVPRPRLRIPSLLRFTMLMRNARFQALPIPRSLLDEVGDAFVITEKGRPLELTETNQFLGSGNRLKTNVLILLDYSGSMFEAALIVAGDPNDPLADDHQLGFPVPADPLQYIYENCISQLIDELPDNYNIGLAYFNDRTPSSSSAIRIVRAFETDPPFTRDKFELQSRLSSIQVIDHGGSELLPAIEDGALLLESIDVAQDLIAFDDADVRALVMVTDGRLTTPPGNIGATEKILIDRNVRLLSVGWGNQVLADPLIRIGSTTGGHFYGTKELDTGEPSPGGNSTIKIPLLEGLQDWCFTDVADVCDQSIAKDLQSQVVLSYVTLREETGVAVGAEITFNDPNDNDNFCLDDVLENNGGFVKSQLDLLALRGDQRLGQISIRTDGIRPSTTIGTAEVYVRAEYVPRNVNRYAFLIDVAGGLPPGATMTVEQVSAPQGGLLQGWQSSVRTLTKGFAGRTEYSFSLPDPVVSPAEALEFGDFGDLLLITFDRIDPATPLTLLFDVVDPVINPTPSVPDAKYISAPDSFELTDVANFAPAFPTPVVEFIPVQTTEQADDANADARVINTLQELGFDLDETSVVLDLGTGVDQAMFTISNRGGSHAETGVNLNWFMSLASSFLALPVPFSLSESGIVTSTFDFDDVPVTLDRTIDPGFYLGDVNFSYLYGSLGISFVDEPIYILYQVTDPILTVLPGGGLNFGLSETNLQITISNTGQSTLNWEFNFAAFPSWLSVNQAAGSLTPGVGNETDTISLQVFRAAVRDSVPLNETLVFTYDLIISVPDLPNLPSAPVTVPISVTVSNP